MNFFHNSKVTNDFENIDTIWFDSQKLSSQIAQNIFNVFQSQTTENLADNQIYQAESKSLCNKILFS